MTLKDESSLTAYLDGELESDERSSVESALLSDPELAAELGRLAAVRDLVGGLSRPVLPVDLASELGHRLGRSPVPRHLRSRLTPRWRAFAVVSLAASLLLALGLA